MERGSGGFLEDLPKIDQCAIFVDQLHEEAKCQKDFLAEAKARRGFEPRLPDSESGVLTVTPPGQMLT